MTVTFLFAAFIPNIGWINENVTCPILNDYKKGGYRWLTIPLYGRLVDVIYDTEDMRIN